MMEADYGAVTEPTLDGSTSRVKDQTLLKGESGEKVSGKAWGRVKNIFTRRSRYPLSVFFILGTEFCERFCYYGLRTILVLYLTNWLRFSQDSATAIYHGSSMLAYFSPILGAIIADGYIGRYRTILYLSIVYCVGNLVLALTALPPPEQIGPIIGLLVIGLGTGGIKPCVSAFGGDQFQSSQEKERTTFFSVFYFMINLGSVLSTFITPVLRADVHCIGDSCYPLAFGVPALLMFLAITIFIAGTRMYKRNPPTGNIIGKVVKCIWHALCRGCRRDEMQEKTTHWLDRASDKYEESFIEDVKVLLKVLWLFLPLPLFWALFDQQGSRWTLQAEEMDGTVTKHWRVKPDQFQVLNPLLIIILIPIFENIFYPLLDCCRISHRPLQRMVVGMSLSVVAFLIAGLVQMKIDTGKEAPLAAGESTFHVINSVNCNITVTSPFYNGTLQYQQSAGLFTSTSGKMKISAGCEDRPTAPATSTFTFQGATAYRVVLMNNSRDALSILQFNDKRTKTKNGTAELSVISNLPYSNTSHIKLVEVEDTPTATPTSTHVLLDIHRDSASSYRVIDPGLYSVSLLSTDGSWTPQGVELSLGTGATYTLVLTNPSTSDNFTGKADAVLYLGAQVNEVSMFYLVPQYLVITLGEVLFSVTGLAFAYSQAPNGLKSVVQAAWLLTTAVGDLVVVVVAEVQLLPSQTAEFFLFAVLMGVATIIFAVMTRFYTYLYVTSSSSASDSDETGLVEGGHKEDIPLKHKQGKEA